MVGGCRSYAKTDGLVSAVRLRFAQATPVAGPNSSSRSGLAAAVEHPLHAEAILEAPIVVAPELLLQRHLHRAAVAERLEEPVGFRACVGFQVDVDVVALTELETHGLRRVSPHDQVTGQDGQGTVHNEFL